MRAIARAQDARDAIVARLLAHAQREWPDEWTAFAPLPFRFASWVGYDMDGRTDIGWAQSIGFRLAEKAERLARYVAALEAIDAGHPLLGELRPSAGYAAARAKDFAADLSDPAALSVAANRLTANDPRKLLSLGKYIEALEDEARAWSFETAPQPAASAPPQDERSSPLSVRPEEELSPERAKARLEGPQRAVALKTLAAAMRADGLGMGWIHFRVNAKQLHNGIRRRLDPEGELDLSSKGAVAYLRKAIAKVKPLRSNFAALATESSTAIRQFLAMAQICAMSTPTRRSGCWWPNAKSRRRCWRRCISPGCSDRRQGRRLAAVRTEQALEHGGRFLDALLARRTTALTRASAGGCRSRPGSRCRAVRRANPGEPRDRAVARAAGAGDGGQRLSDVAALVFNTHGESMGRGAHPDSLADRLAWPLSPWARRRFARAGIRLEPEVSFQGGDGYLFFATPELALRR
jgi:phosphoenolpyruvate carboxylase